MDTEFQSPQIAITLHGLMIPPDVKAMSAMGRVNDLMATRIHRYMLAGKKWVVPQMHDPECVVHNRRKSSLPLCTVKAVFLESTPSPNTLNLQIVYLLRLSLFLVSIHCDCYYKGFLLSAWSVIKARTREIISLRPYWVFLLLCCGLWFIGLWCKSHLTSLPTQTHPKKRTLKVYITDCLKASSTSAPF